MGLGVCGCFFNSFPGWLAASEQVDFPLGRSLPAPFSGDEIIGLSTLLP